MILDYTELVAEERQKLESEFHFPLSTAIQTGFFAGVNANCMYCVRVMDKPISIVEDGGAGHDYVNQVFACPDCGWWYETELSATYVGGGDQLALNRKWFGVLRTYDASSIELPVASLRIALAKKRSILNELHPRKLEELVGAVLKDHLDCAVQHVGRSGDGGIDLVLVRGEKSWVVQVKRRLDPKSREGVQPVRELVGAMALEKQYQGIFVTTAQAFTRGARTTADKAAAVGAVTKIDLIDLTRFIDLCDLTSRASQKPWEVARTRRHH